MSNVGNNEAAVLNILNELCWQNFPPKWIDQPHFTIWQAIGYILNNAESANEILDAYVRAINDAEMELFDELCAEDTYKQLIDTNQLDESDPKVKGAKRTITAQALEDWLQLLEKNRFVTTEHFPIPSLLYQVLQAEINKHLNGKGASLKIIEKKIKGFTEKQILFARSSLDKWSTVDTVSVLGLIGAAEKVSARAIRSQIFESHEKIIAMFMHLISELFPNDFTPRGKPDPIKIDKFVKLLVGNAAYRKSEFPQDTTCATILQKSEKTYDEVRRKPKFELPEKGYPRLRAHIKKNSPQQNDNASSDSHGRCRVNHSRSLSLLSAIDVTLRIEPHSCGQRPIPGLA